ncbi:hypothetical protein K504DRAFT_384821 [Pleomassaria siparia CBS 279.74]|uniref:Uncharacterized protein n=1 Tax=Pleomassaria siparia CBS 279.74 TaxID=1314801 RepID=A0A6G1K1I1_9PLEO|nr:hypothetical protein K504DRAFT_384821 [Pleomassaria siparia CBS 279.74]
MPQVILYDLPSKPPCKSWSLNPWKSRMVLNIKRIDYKTEWIEYPDLAPTLKSFGLPPNNPNDPDYFTDYSSPAIRYEDGTYMMDSWPIVHELEKRYPTPSMHLDDPVVTWVKENIRNITIPLMPQLLPKVPRVLLNKISADYYDSTREVRFGMPLAQLEKEKGGEQNWEELKGPTKTFGDVLKKNGGPFFLGETVVSYADVIFVSFLQCIRRVSEDMFQRYLSLDPAFGKVYEASKEWLKKDD